MPLLIFLAVILLVGAFMWRGRPHGDSHAPHHGHGPRFMPLAGLLLLGVVLFGAMGRGGRFGGGSFGHMGGAGFAGGRLGYMGGPGFWPGSVATEATAVDPVWFWVMVGVRALLFVGLLVAGYLFLKRQGFFDRPEVRHLRQRLANGEITPAEYDQLLPKLKG